MPERLSALWNGCLLLGPARGGEFEGRPGLATLFTDENLNLRLYRHERCLPRIRSVPETRTVSTLQEAVETVAQPDFQVEEVALVEHGPNRRWGSAELSDVVSDEQALTSRITAGPGGAFVVAAIPWSRGWQASVDGIQTSISIVDGALMGFQVPEGAHRLELRYRIPGLLPGALLSLLGTIVAIALLLRRARPSSLPEADRSTESSRPTV